MDTVRRSAPGRGRSALWFAACAATALHGLALWAYWSPRALMLSQLGVSLALVALALVLRPGLGRTLAGLAVNLVFSIVAMLAGAAIVVAGFH